MSKKTVYVVLSLIGISNIFIFQNCSKSVSFTKSELEEASGASLLIATTLPPIVCDEADHYLNPATNECELFACSSYEEISGSDVTVPARDITTGKCYYSKMAAAQTQSLELDLLSRNHGRPGGEVNLPPVILAEKNIRIILTEHRALKLAGAPNDVTVPIAVDNYIFVRMNNDSYMQAYGTGDSTVRINNINTNYILYKNNPVPFTSYEGGGTAHIAEMDVTGNLPIGVQTDISIQALDCGGGQHINPIYIVYQ